MGATDANFNDRTGLCAIASRDDERRAADLVFVHGLGGGSHSTWMSGKQPESFWPAWLARDFPDLAVWTLGYSADVSAWKRQSMPIADRGTGVLETLTNEGIGERPVIFITHSMGGLLTKQILRHAVSFGVRRWESIAESTCGIAFIATPHAGSDLANFADFARAVLRSNEQVVDMKAHHPRLRELHNWFRKFQGDTGLVCRTYCEMREVRPGVLGLKLPKGFLVVDQTSAEPHIPGEVAIPLDDDHVSICKPSSPDAPLYKSIKRFVSECRDNFVRGSARADGTSSASTAGIAGAWTSEVVASGQKPYRIRFDFEVLNGRLFGTVHYPTGSAAIEQAVLEGERIAFRTVHTPQFETEPAEIRFEGSLGDDSLEFIVQSRSGHARGRAVRS